MGSSRTVDAFEPVLIEKRGEGRLPKRRLPDDPEQRSRCLILLAQQRRNHCRTLGSFTIECVRTRPKPKLDQPSPLGRSQHEMGNLVKDYVRVGNPIQSRPVPVEATRSSLGMDRQTKGACKGKCRKAMPLCFRCGGTIGRGRAYPRKDRAGKPVAETSHKAVQGACELVIGYRR